MKSSFIVVAIAWLAPAAHACSCVSMTPHQQLQRAAAVFAGRIDAVSMVDAANAWEPRAIVRISVARVWKGDVPAQLSMYTAVGASTCNGFGRDVARKGAQVLVFAERASPRLWKQKPAEFVGPPVPVVRQDLVDALADDATIYGTSICSGTTSWAYAGIPVDEFGPFRVPKRAIVMKDPPPADYSALPKKFAGLPGVCWEMRMGNDSSWVSSAPPPEAGLFEKLLREDRSYRDAVANVTGQPRDRWWRDGFSPGRYALCRTTRADVRACGALYATFVRVGSHPPEWAVQTISGKACPARK